MISRRNALLAMAAASTAVTAPFAGFAAEAAAASSLGAAQRWLETLSPTQRDAAMFAVGDSERYNWHYTPRHRQGLALNDMTDAQQSLAMGILEAGLSADGYRKAMDVMRLETVLREIETFGFSRDPENYAFSVFGEPARFGRWAWRFEGHHVSLNMAFKDGMLAGSTPCFLGANPAIVPSGALTGHQMLKDEVAAAHGLLQTLDKEQRDVAVIRERAFGDIVSGPGREASLVTPAGIAAIALNHPQRDLLAALIDRFVAILPEQDRKRELDRVRGSGLDGVHFSWAGSTNLDHGHYFRVHGPRILIEYDNSRNNANHVHSVWLDPGNLFGRDVLGAHYRDAHRHA